MGPHLYIFQTVLPGEHDVVEVIVPQCRLVKFIKKIRQVLFLRWMTYFRRLVRSVGKAVVCGADDPGFNSQCRATGPVQCAVCTQLTS